MLLSLDELIMGRTIVYGTDSLVTQIIYAKGSSNMELHVMAVECRNLDQILKVKLRTACIPRSRNTEADGISKMDDFNDWRFLWTSFRNLND